MQGVVDCLYIALQDKANTAKLLKQKQQREQLERSLPRSICQCVGLQGVIESLYTALHDEANTAKLLKQKQHREQLKRSLQGAYANGYECNVS